MVWYSYFLVEERDAQKYPAERFKNSEGRYGLKIVSLIWERLI